VGASGYLVTLVEGDGKAAGLATKRPGACKRAGGESVHCHSLLGDRADDNDARGAFQGQKSPETAKNG
jgi:hypothetical protein